MLFCYILILQKYNLIAIQFRWFKIIFLLIQMVRLEKIVYQQVLNNNTLGRARKLTTPSKWYRVNSFDHMQRYSHEFFNNTLFGRFMKPFMDKWFYFQRDYQRDILLQQGLTFEDKSLHHDAELRRNLFWEHIFRESLHPYHWILKARRRERYYKVERAVRGFFVPQYIRNQAKSQTYLDYYRLLKQWTEFTFNNYFSQITPYPKRTTLPVKSPIDYAMNYGMWRSEAWERYFVNSRDRGWFSPQEVEITRNPKKFPYDLTTPEGKKRFERQISELNEKHPGIYAPEGHKFDFKKHYAEIGA